MSKAENRDFVDRNVERCAGGGDAQSMRDACPKPSTAGALGPGAWGLGPGAWGLGPGAWGLQLEFDVHSAAAIGLLFLLCIRRPTDPLEMRMIQ
jgi:hypothetical protein